MFVVALVGAVAVCGALSIEAWPLSGFRLFSREREVIATGWMVTSVDARGRERPVPFTRFPRANRRFIGIMHAYDGLDPGAQEATCGAWARLARRHGASTAGGLRLYATTRDLRAHVGRRRPVATVRALRWTCADGHGARAAVAQTQIGRATASAGPP